MIKKSHLFHPYQTLTLGVMRHSQHHSVDTCNVAASAIAYTAVRVRSSEMSSPTGKLVHMRHLFPSMLSFDSIHSKALQEARLSTSVLETVRLPYWRVRLISEVNFISACEFSISIGKNSTEW